MSCSYGGVTLWILKTDLHLYESLRNSWTKTANSSQRQACVPNEDRYIWFVCLSWIWEDIDKIVVHPPITFLYFVLEFSCNGFLWPGIINSPWIPCFLPKIKFCVLYQLSRAAVTKYHRLSGFNHRHLFSPSSGGWQSKMAADCVPPETLPWVLTWPFLWVSVRHFRFS